MPVIGWSIQPPMLEELLDDRRFVCEGTPAVEAVVRTARADPVQTFDKALKGFPAFECHQAK